jgi:TolB-like protein
MQNLISELKRRNVFRVAVAYLVAGWLLLQVTDLAVGLLSLPDWTLRLVGFLIVLGLPLVLIFTWVYELTPEGLKKEKDLVRDDAAVHHAQRRLNLVIAGLMIIVVPMLTVQLISRGGIGSIILPDSAPEIQQRVDASGMALPEYDSVAVLPFVNMSDDPGNEYFSDGLTEELLNLLADVRGLRVPSRTSSFAFKGKNVDITVIARELGVNHVLEGSVRKSGDHIRVTAQLIDIKTDTHLWSETYDRKLADIFEIQDDIAGRIVAVLRQSLGSRGELPQRTQPTDDMQAYELYLQGLELFRRRADSMAGAVDLLKQAVARDPDFAAAWAALSAVYVVQFDYTPDMDIQSSLALARPAAERALVLDPGSSLAQAVMGISSVLSRPPQWAQAFEQFEAGIAGHPRDATLRQWYGQGLLQAGYLEAGQMQLLAAYRQNPASGVISDALGMAYMLTGGLDKAVGYFNRAIALGHASGLDHLRLLYFKMGLSDRVLAPMPELARAIPADWWSALVAAKQDPTGARELIRLTDDYRSGYLPSAAVFDEGLADLGLLESFSDSIRARYVSVNDPFTALWYPWNMALRQTPEFQGLMRDVGLLDLWRIRGFPDLCKEDAGQLVCQ